MKSQGATVDTRVSLRLAHRQGPQHLGDMLQRLARIAPEDVYAITVLTRDVLREAEKRYRRHFPHDPAA